jgi:hypothetical protein
MADRFRFAFRFALVSVSAIQLVSKSKKLNC